MWTLQFLRHGLLYASEPALSVSMNESYSLQGPECIDASALSEWLEERKVLLSPQSPVPFSKPTDLEVLREELPRYLRSKNISDHPGAVSNPHCHRIKFSRIFPTPIPTRSVPAPTEQADLAADPVTGIAGISRTWRYTCIEGGAGHPVEW